MALRTAEAVWNGDLKSGKGRMKLGSGAWEGPYSFSSRFEDGQGSNPEELIGAAHAGCFTMALASGLGKKNLPPERLHTVATLIMEMVDQKWTITKMRLEVEGRVPNMNQAEFQQTAQDAEQGCPISRLLRPGLQNVEVVAKLV